MNNINEILSRLDFNEWEVDLYKVPITWCEMYDIRNYVEKLQRQLEAYENMRLEINSYICNNSQYDDNIDDCWVRTNELIEIIDKVGGSDE